MINEIIKQNAFLQANSFFTRLVSSVLAAPRLNSIATRSRAKIHPQNLFFNGSSFSFSTANKKPEKEEPPKTTLKEKIKKYSIYFFLATSSSFSIYTFFLYKRRIALTPRNIKNTLLSDTSSLYKYIYASLYLPYNSFVLLDKLQPVTKPIEKTLVINLDKTIVSYQYSLLNGFEILKRPGLEKFIEELGKVYEIVIFSHEDPSLVEEISSKLDPKGELLGMKLGKESVRYYKGKSIKDLNYLNRNLKNVIVLDCDINNVPLHPENTIILPEFKGNGKDRELLYMIVFLKEMAKTDVTDVRTEIQKWGNYKPYEKFYKSDQRFYRFLPKNH